MLNLTLSERNYLVELIRKDQKEKKPMATQFYINTNELIQYFEGQSFVDGVDGNDKETDNTVDLCPNCKVYCIKRFVDGRCE